MCVSLGSQLLLAQQILQMFDDKDIGKEGRTTLMVGHKRENVDNRGGGTQQSAQCLEGVTTHDDDAQFDC